MPAILNPLTALGWSLLDSVWQMAVLWAIYCLLTAGNKRISAAGKHNLILLFVVFGAEWFAYSLFHLLKTPMDPVVSWFLPVSTPAGQWIPYLGGLYLMVLTVRFLQYGFHHADRLANRSPISISPLLQTFTDRCVRILGITKPVMVYLSEFALTAETSGFFKPLILLPVSLLTRLSPAQVEAILVHELYHIRRNDYLINIGMSCFRSVFFFNPFAHLFFKAIERERELACDDGVLELGYEPGVYAEALFSLEKYRQVNPGFSLAADGNRPWLLMQRIRRVLGEPALKENRFNPLLLSGLAAAFAFFVLQLMIIPPGHKDGTPTRDSAIPVHFEIAEEKMAFPAPEVAYSTPEKHGAAGAEHHWSIKKNKMVSRKQVPSMQTMVVTEEPTIADQAIYADNNIVRNYSNESPAGPVTDNVQVFQGSPFVPSSSLSYEDLPKNAIEDSALQLQMEKTVKDVLIADRMNSIVVLKKMQKEMENDKNQLVETELKNKNQIILDQQNTLPLLKKIHRDLRIKKKELEKLQIRLQVSSEEIIHI
jgi:Zn-dependent protease with chaperone function